MSPKTERMFRKKVRDFKGHIQMMNKTPLKDLENLFLEIHENALQDYITTERKRNPQKSRKEIIIEMYQLHDKLKGKRNSHAKSL